MASGVVGAVAVTSFAVVLKTLVLAPKVLKRVRPRPQPGDFSAATPLATLVRNFALPAMLRTFAASGSTWFGFYLLSRRPDGFADLALVNVGIQWRTPIIILATIVGSVVIPTMRSKFEQGKMAEVRALKHALLRWTGFAAAGGAGLISLTSPRLLSAYGEAFAGGSLILSLIVASAVPEVIANAHLQQVVAEGQAWLQLRHAVRHFSSLLRRTMGGQLIRNRHARLFGPVCSARSTAA